MPLFGFLRTSDLAEVERTVRRGDAALRSGMTANAASIAANTTSISGNAASIAANTESISGNAALIDRNYVRLNTQIQDIRDTASLSMGGAAGAPVGGTPAPTPNLNITVDSNCALHDSTWKLSRQAEATGNSCNDKGGCGIRNATANHSYIISDCGSCLRHRAASGGAVAWTCYDPSSAEGSEEMWSYLPNGKIRNVASGMCISGPFSGGPIPMENCEGGGSSSLSYF